MSATREPSAGFAISSCSLIASPIALLPHKWRWRLRRILHQIRKLFWSGPWYPNTFWMLHSIWLARAVYIAAALGIADRLEGRPKSADQLAGEVGCDARYLYRMLRALAGFGIFRQDREGRFHLNSRATELLSNAHPSMRYWALKSGDENWRASAAVLEAVRSGKSGFELVHGMSSWNYYATHDQARDNFIAAMSTFTEWQSREIVAAGDFGRFAKIVDVGGGRGALIAEILSSNPGTRGVVYDLPETIPDAVKLLADRGLAERSEAVGGSFLDSVPAGGDLYISKHSLRDWNDENAIRILKNVRAAAKKDATLMIIDAVVDERNGSDKLVKLLDLELLICEGGGMRTLDEFKRLLELAGFEFRAIRRTCIEDVVLLEAAPV